MPESDGKRHRIRMLIPLWGAVYFERWVEIAADSLCAKGNIPHLHAHADFELVFLTKSRDLSFVRDVIVPRLIPGIAVRTITIDEFFPRNAPISYPVPLSLAYLKGIQDLRTEGIGSYVILMNGDFVLSDSSLAALMQKIKQGYQIISAPSIRVDDHAARPALYVLGSANGSQGFAPRALMSLAQRHFHQTVLARIINERPIIEAWEYHVLYWRISKDCLAARYFLLMPYCFQVCRQITKATTMHDYGLVDQVCPGGRYTALTDSDEFLMIELQQRDSEAYHLMPAPSTRSPAEEIERKLAQVIASAGRWSTAEHRRAFEHTLVFHSQDLSAEDHAKLVEFDMRVTEVLGRLPPPISQRRHPQWLGAVHHYRADMTADGAPYPDLINDEANRIPIVLSAAHTESLWASARRSPIDLADYFGPVCAAVTLGELAPDLARPSRAATLFLANVQDAHNSDLNMDICLDTPPSFAPGRGLGIYLLIDSLAHWPKFRKLCDQVLAAGAEVRLVFRDSNWAERSFVGNEWILSLLSYYFSGYSAALEFISTAAKDADQSAGSMVSDIDRPGSGNFVSPIRTKTFIGFTVCLVPSNRAQ